VGEPIIEGSLTGARRFVREVLFRNHDYQDEGLVLQVQYNTWVNGSETKPNGRWATMWRDATPADVQEEVV
jgi:hypothetical protein